MINWVNKLILDVHIDQGNRKDISRSNTKNKIAIRKNLIEKGSPGLWKGSKPHSYTETFSLSGDFSPNIKDAKDITEESSILITSKIKIINKSKPMNYFFGVVKSVIDV